MRASFTINRRPPDQVSANQTVSPPVATASASAPVPTIQISIAAPAATAAASAPTPAPQINVLPAAATASASAPTPSLVDTLVVPVATASANSPPPVPAVRLLPPAATAAASSPTPVPGVSVVAPAASSSASSPTPIPGVTILPPAATASASAPTPIVTTGAVVTAPAATASASAPTPTIQIGVAPPAATASASAPTPTPQLKVSPAAATAAASAPAPTPQLRVSPAAATAAASSLVPVPQVRLSPPAAAASANALVPTVTTGGGSTTTITTPLSGYVYGAPASGAVSVAGSGSVTIGLSGVATAGATGITGWAFPANDVCALGYSNQVLGGVVVGDVETLIGRTFTGLRQNQAYTTTGVAAAITEYDAGRTTSYRSIQFDTAPGGWAAVAAGVADTQLTAFCTAVTNANRWTPQNPFWVCLHHEATLSPFGTAGFSAADYKAMWAHCVPFMLATGAPIAFAYIGWDRMFVGANGIGPPTAGQGIDDLDPGSSLYSRIGSDVYNAIDSPGVLRYSTVANVLLEPIRVAAVARGKDWMIGEMGCEDGATTQDHQNKAAWLDSLRVYLDGLGTTGPGVCRAMLTTIKASAENYNVDSSAESLAAWRRLGFDSYYG